MILHIISFWIYFGGTPWSFSIWAWSTANVLFTIMNKREFTILDIFSFHKFVTFSISLACYMCAYKIKDYMQLHFVLYWTNKVAIVITRIYVTILITISHFWQFFLRIHFSGTKWFLSLGRFWTATIFFASIYERKYAFLRISTTTAATFLLATSSAYNIFT